MSTYSQELAACTFLFLFFSSRRRHTRCGRDWSSDVCSSDLSQSESRRPYGLLWWRAASDPPQRLQDRTGGPRLGGRKPLPIHAGPGARQCELAWLGGGGGPPLGTGGPCPPVVAGALFLEAVFHHVS